jgi:hypothetical protein
MQGEGAHVETIIVDPAMSRESRDVTAAWRG